MTGVYNRKLALVGIIPNQLFSRKFTRSSRCGFVAQWLERATRVHKSLASIPGGAALFFSSDPDASSSSFVGAEREEKLMRNDPDKSEFTIEWIQIQRVIVGRCMLIHSGNPGHLVVEKELTAW